MVARAKYDLLALSENGFAGVIDGWVENVETLLAPEQDPRTKKERKRTAAERRQAYDHKLVAAIAPDFLTELKEADARKAELDAKWKELNGRLPKEPTTGGGSARSEVETDDSDESDADVEEVTLSAEELAELLAEIAVVKKDRAKAGAVVKRLEADFWFPYRSDPPTLGEEPPRLFRARAALDAAEERRVVLALLRNDLASKLNGHVVRWQRELATSYETWERKYAVSLAEICEGRERATAKLDGFLKELGYVD